MAVRILWVHMGLASDGSGVGEVCFEQLDDVTGVQLAIGRAPIFVAAEDMAGVTLCAQDAVDEALERVQPRNLAAAIEAAKQAETDKAAAEEAARKARADAAEVEAQIAQKRAELDALSHAPRGVP